MTAGPAAVVFDLDGVLIDSEPVWDEVRRGLATEHGRPWPEDATTAMQGMSTSEWSRYLVDTVGVSAPPDQVAAEVIARMDKRYREQVPLLPGAVDAVRRTADHWPLAVASSSPPPLIRRVLDSAGIADRFQALVSSEEVERGKPAPDVYLAAADRLGVPATDCAAVEDSTDGVRAAYAAGMTVLVVPNPHYPPAPAALALAAAVVPRIAELSAAVLRNVGGGT